MEFNGIIYDYYRFAGQLKLENLLNRNIFTDKNNGSDVNAFVTV